MTDILAKIKTQGHWKIIIHPHEFDPNRIGSLNDCKKIIMETKVSLRGWSFPHYDIHKEPRIGLNYVEQDIDWSRFTQFWRYYQSGQFVFFSNLWEDESYDANNILSLIGTVYFLTEIFEFASRLASKNLLSDECSVYVELKNIKNRQLRNTEPGRMFLMFGECETELENIPFGLDIKSHDLISQAHEKALEGVQYIFERFNWNKSDPNFFKEDQRKLLEKRI
jgi:hypothetical protein